VNPGSQILDIGANIGFYTRYLSKLAGPSGKVYSFEADKGNFSHLEKNTRQLTNIQLFNLAVSDREGSLTMYLSHRLNVDNRTYEPEQYRSSYTVRAARIDDIIPTGTPVSLIKMDIQGSEFLALKGMDRVLSENKDLIILSEYAPDYLEKCSGTTSRELQDFFTEKGFRLYFLRDGKFVDFDAEFRGEGGDDIYYENIIATRKELR
jgi:FkbM family methyltransferase